MRKQILLILFVAFLLNSNSYSQELKCSISISSQKIQGTNKQVFDAMRKAVNEYMNTTKWTKHKFKQDEKIECNIIINLTEQVSSDEFKGNLQIQSRRPVYGSSYSSTMINFKDDDIQFKYVEYEPLLYNESTTPNSLTALLAYYAYIIIGLDYDSMSPMGGTEYFTKAEAIVQKMQNSRYKGWKSYESRRNRYWLTENLMNSAYQPVRDCYYKYHRIGLDRMADKLMDARMELGEAIKMLQKAHRAKPGSFILQFFFNAKSDEIVNIFSGANMDEKKQVYNIVSEIDPGNITKYKKIISNK
ncbi:MAG: DUF4835 family protein [Marinifilaceae bacterium]|jgi:hypothetical protein|nr:DUF4835 family protein [Marinifilaceae bacterium]